MNDLAFMCVINGRLGGNPEMRYTSSGQTVTSFRMAVDDSYTDQQSGQKVKRTMWIKITTWGKLAEVCNQYLSTGREVTVMAKPTVLWEDDPKSPGAKVANGVNVWTDNNGNPRASLEYTAKEVLFHGSANGGGGGGGGTGQAPAQAASSNSVDMDIPF